MSELDTRLAELRDGLHESLAPPDVSTVADRARQRDVRRRMQVGAIAAVVLVSVAVPVLRSLPADGGRAADPPAAPPTPYEVDFVDAEHGYALGSDCEAEDEPCSFTLLATADGGRHWERRAMPDEDGTYTLVQMTAFDADRLMLSRASTDEEVGYSSIISADSGRTWREVRQFGLGPPSRIPAGGFLGMTCIGTAEDQSDSCDYGIGVSLPESGTVAPVLTQPGLIEPQPGDSATAGGHHWAVGRDPVTGTWAVTVTADEGETWTTTPIDLPGEPARNDPWAVVEGGGVMYLTAVGSVSTGPVGLLAVYRSTDDGKSWTRTWRTTETEDLQAVIGSPVATEKGHLLVYSASRGTFGSTDGRRFERADRQLPGEVAWTRGGYLAERPDHAYELSTDGVEWRKFELPR
jgi:photosystem II stability/assembly factor-like uncharacterized protein